MTASVRLESRGSASLLQRRIEIGYSRAPRRALRQDQRGVRQPLHLLQHQAIRGTHRSRPIDAVLTEHAELEADCVTEVFLRVRMIREVIPGATIRSTVIVGFPTETEEHFATLLEFFGETRFDRLGCFTCSDEEETPSQRVADQVSAMVMARCERTVMRLHESIAAERNAAPVGTVEEVIVDGHDGGHWVDRTRRDVPDIDGLVFFAGPEDLAPGDFVAVEVTGAMAHDLTGRVRGCDVQLVSRDP